MGDEVEKPRINGRDLMWFQNLFARAGIWDEGYFVLPTVVTGLAPDAPLVTTEQFGPVIPILPFADEDEAVRVANGTEYGLGASPMSLPFGGFKQSGVGRNHGLESVLACTELQAVVEFDDPTDLPGTDHWKTHLG
jgi:aldehyde dehydrogenase